jgi:hypothetical protein
LSDYRRWLDELDALLTDELSKEGMAILRATTEFVVQDSVPDCPVSMFLGDVGLSGIERYNW